MVRSSAQASTATATQQISRCSHLMVRCRYRDDVQLCTSCDCWTCSAIDRCAQRLAARSTGSADTAGTMVLHLAEPAATELAELVQA